MQKNRRLLGFGPFFYLLLGVSVGLRVWDLLCDLELRYLLRRRGQISG